MTWFRVDDKSAFHAKVIGVGNEAWGAFCRAGAWCAERLTDGVIPSEVALLIAPKRVWERLISAGFLRKNLTDTRVMFVLHDYLEWNLSGENVRANRDRKAKNIRDFRAKRNQPGNRLQDGQVAADVTGNVTALQPGRNRVPYPYPDPEKKEAEEKKDSARLPGLDILETEIRRHELFATLDAHAIAKAQAERLLTAPQKPEWLVVAIRDCVEKNVGQGLNAKALQSVLVGFMRKAKRPEPQPPSHKPAVVDSEEEQAKSIADAAKRLADREAKDAARLANEAKAKAGRL